MGFFTSGYKEVDNELAKREVEKKKRSQEIWRFFVTAAEEEAEVRFLTGKPINYAEHMYKTFEGGKDKYTFHTCTKDKNCKYCLDGNKASFKGAFLIIDRRSFTNKDGKTFENQLRLYIQGPKVLSQLKRYETKYGITNRDMTIERAGTGTSTSYSFDRGEEDILSEKEIRNLLPEHLQEIYDGTEDSLLNIVIQALTPVDELAEVEVEEEVSSTSSNLVSVEDEEEKPKKLRTRFGRKKTDENSVKSLYRK